MFCLRSEFHGHRGRYISGEIKPIFPCHNCAVSRIHYIELFIKKKTTLLIWHVFPAFVVRKGGMAALFVLSYSA